MTNRASLTVAVAQPLTIAHDVAGNARRHADLVRRAGAHVVGFPELSLTGYEYDAAAIDTADERLEPLVRACGEVCAVAFAGAPVAAGDGRRHIAVLRVSGTGAQVAYRKRFLGGDEPDHFVPGPAPAVAVVDGLRVGLAICKDTGMPQHDRDTAGLGMDLYLAGVVEDAAQREVLAARARRIAAEHRVWVAVASCAGATGAGYDRTAGQSSIWRPDGIVTAVAGAEPDDLAVAMIDHRTDRPPFDDR